ncbi:MAG: hypothetical protein ACR2PK_16435 [Acidimicrobiales bacterium]
MSTRLVIQATALTLVVVCVVGFVDAVVDDRAGPAVLFAALAVGVIGLARLRVNETTVHMRRDLASWLERVAPVTGESVDELSDSAVSRLRAGFTQLSDGE